MMMKVRRDSELTGKLRKENSRFFPDAIPGKPQFASFYAMHGKEHSGKWP